MSGGGHGDGHGGGGLPLMEVVEHFLHTGHEKGGVHLMARPIVIAYAVSIVFFLIFAFDQSLRNFMLVMFLSPIWITAILSRFAIYRFVQEKRAANLARQEYVLLEIRLPRDTMKTPLAMELVLSSLHLSPGESTWYKKYFLGAVRPWWSLEIASLGGRLHFFVWTRKGLRRLVESAFYAQYPGIEIIEAQDYTKLIEPTAHNYRMFGCEYQHGKSDVYPIKTYIDYGNDRPGAKPEEQMDPLTQLLEAMGSIGPEEQMWLQFIIRVTKEEKFGQSWTKVAEKEVARIREDLTPLTQYLDPATGKHQKIPGFPNPTKGQSDMMAAIERNVSKLGFDVGIRSIYTAPADKFDGSMITFQIGLFKPFNNVAHNSLGAASRLSAKYNDWPWEDPGGHHKHHDEHTAVEMYRRRMYFYDPYIAPWNIMSTEEIATLYHIPSRTVVTPGLPRIQSATSEAPVNLPT